MTKLRGRYSGELMRQLESLFRQGVVGASSEGELLERFVSRRDESAFEALMARHGPMVLGVCRQLLHDPNDIDDAFQATFLVLVRKASTLRRCDLLGNWLYGVAYRIALRARSSAARRMTRTEPFDGVAGVHPVADSRVGAETGLSYAIQREQTPWLHQEISHLPEKYRVPIVLCYLEGATHDEAASRLGWSVGTVKGRLARARELLRRRLVRRGVAVSLAGLTAMLDASDSKAAVPAPLGYATLTAAQAVVAHAGAPIVAASTVSLPVAALVEGALQAMILNQFKAVAFPLIVVGGTVATGVAVAAAQLSGRAGNSDPGVSTVAAGDSAPDGAPQVGKTQDRPFGKRRRTAQGDASRPAPDALAARLAAEREVFEKRLKEKLESPDDVRRLADWSALVLEADLMLSSGQTDRVAVTKAHRDRMEALSEALRKLPESPAALRLAAEEIHEAEQWLESESNGRPIAMNFRRTPTMGMGGRGMMGAMMGGGMGGRGMMGGGMRGGGMGSSMAMMGSSPRTGSAAGGSAAAAPSGDAGPHEARPSGAAPGAEPAGTAPPAGGSGAGGLAGGAAGTGGIAGRGGMTMGMGRAGGAGMAAGMSGTGGAPAGMAAGMMGQMLGRPEMRERNLRRVIAESVARMAAQETNPKTQAIFKKLEEPIAMPFPDDTPLDDVLKYIRGGTASPNFVGIPIYVDPKGLEETNKTMQSTVTLNLEGIPLRTSLRLILKQLGLAYCVRDGVLIISSVEGISGELAEAQSEAHAKTEDEGGDTP
jgi:RNA polymerase sigma factor (sigma-70 family)